MSYDNNMSGALFKNKQKEEGSKQPDYRGECEIDGKKYEVAGWMRQSNKGMPYMSLKFQEPRQEKPRQEEKPKAGFDDMDSGIPF